jgi:hypothetical protein
VSLSPTSVRSTRKVVRTDLRITAQPSLV